MSTILIACEFSGIVREAFRAKGFDAWSIDLEDTEIPSEFHIIDDVSNHLVRNFNMMIAFPPCTHLAVSGARWFPEKIADGRQQKAIDFFMELITAPIDRIAVENPIGIMSTKYRKPDQIIEPFQFGHKRRKKTCLWLKNLPELIPTNIVEAPKNSYVWTAGSKSYENFEDETKGMSWSSNEIKKYRNRFHTGIADAMADQWGNVI